MPEYATIRGKIAYIHDARGENGREWFTLTTHRDGSRTVRALCEMDEIGLLRDVTFTVGADFAPRDCFNRLRVHERFAGSSLFLFEGATVSCVGTFPGEPRRDQSVTLQHRTPVFACHPLFVDGWHAAAHDPAGPAGVQLLQDCTNSSMKLDGSTAPLIGVVRKGLERIGPETLETPAGRFETMRYRIHPMRVEAPDWTPLDFWVTGPDLILVRLRWDMIAMTYELVALER